MAVCLEQGVDLHMAQPMPLPLTVSCFSKINPDWFCLSGTGSPGYFQKRAIKWVCVCVCVHACVCVLYMCNEYNVNIDYVSHCGIWAGRRPPLGSSQAVCSVISEGWRCSNCGDTPSFQLLIFAVMILITFFYLGERYWTAPSYFPSLVLVKSLYCDNIFVVTKCTVL